MVKIKGALVPVILSGGEGSRLWPVSREQHPKPFIKLADGESLLQKAWLRGAFLPDVDKVITVTNRELVFKTMDEYRDAAPRLASPVANHLILEPFGRNTAPAIAATALYALENMGPDTVLLVLAADHLITRHQAFVGAVTEACALAEQGKIVTFGITPSGPETGYGYIEHEGVKVLRFVEKPDSAAADRYVKSGNFLWNSGIFCFTVKSMLEEMRRHCKEILDAVTECMDGARTTAGEELIQIEIDPDCFGNVPSDSIDYAVMEKTENAAVVACDIGWSDIGSWKALGDLVPPDGNYNRISGDAIVLGSSNCTIRSESRVIGAVGLDNLVIIDTPDALLVADKDRTQEVKQVYMRLKERGDDAYRLHRTVNRPWGSYTVLEEGPCFKIKRIVVKPGASLSLQKHRYRSEHWVVVAGEAEVLNDDRELSVGVNESTYISAGNKHRLSNKGTENLVIIEVQTGEYLGEDDIIRLEDVYGRIG